MLELVKNSITFLIGGCIVLSVSYIATYINPLLASFVWAYPISIIPSIYYMKLNNKSNQYISKFLFSTTFSLIILFITTYSMSYYFKTLKSSTITLPIIYGSLWWLVLSVLFYYCIKYFKLDTYFM